MVKKPRVQLVAVIAVTAAIAFVPGTSNAENATSGDTASSDAPTGQWFPYGTGPAAASTGDLGDATASTSGVNVVPDQIVPPGGGGGSMGCPTNRFQYTGAKAKWSCYAQQKDGSGHNVWIRTGQSGSSGFGMLHALIDHNLDAYSIVDVIANNQSGILQNNGRYLYGEYFVGSNGIRQYAEVYQERGVGSNSPDQKQLGVVTAYCLDSGHVEESMCPDWVNGTL